VPTSVSIQQSTRKGLANGLRSVLVLAKVLVPVYVAVDLLRQTTMLDLLARYLTPLMQVFGLPGEASMVLVAGYFINLYAAIGAMVPLGLAPREITILGLMLGISHGLLLETAIIRQVGTNWALLCVLRVALSLVAGLLVNGLMP
jgi:hypothetical protein